MIRRKTQERRFGLPGIAALGFTIAAGVARADLPYSGDGNTINGCYSPGGALKLLTPANPTCPDGFTPIQWNVTGPQGPQGPEGPQGPSGVSHVYFAQNSHIVEGGPFDAPQEIVGLSDLPAGYYVIWVTLVGQGGNDAICNLLQDGFPTEARFGVPVMIGAYKVKTGLSVTWPLVATAPAPVRFTVECLDLTDFFGQLDPPIIHGTMIAQPVDALN